MPDPKRMAERFAVSISRAIHDEPTDELDTWQRAADLAGIPDGDVRIIHESGLVYLLGQDCPRAGLGGLQRQRNVDR